MLDDKKVSREKIKSAISNYFLVAIANILTSFLLYFALLNIRGVDLLYLNAWVSGQVMLSLVWVAIHLRYSRNYEAIEGVWDFYIDLPLSILAGLGWGLAWVIFIDPDNLQTAFFLNTAICGVVLGIVVSNPLDQRAMLATLLPCLLPVIIKAFWVGGILFNWIAAIALLFMAAAYGFSQVLQKLYREMLNEREHSRQLVMELEQEKNRVERISQEKTRFLAAASHDLRQPIQVIRLLEGLLSNSVQDQHQKSLVKKIGEANDNLASLLDSILDISKLDSGIIDTQPEEILLNELFEKICENYEHQAGEKSIRLVTTGSRDLCISIDPNHLQRILRNLIENAIRHMGRPGKILLGVRRSSKGLRIEVHDNGLGIPENQQDAVFGEFYQLENSHRNRDKGLGLGLSIVKRLAELNGCEIRLTSKPGNGCCFSLFVPSDFVVLHALTQDDVNNNALAPEEVVVPRQMENKLVLIVEDELDIGKALAVLLKSWRFQVCLANNSESAIENLAGNCPSLILSDYQLSDHQTGLDVITKLKHQTDQVIPSIILTGNTRPDIINFLFRQNIPVLFKPVEPEQLKSAIVKQLSMDIG